MKSMLGCILIFSLSSCGPANSYNRGYVITHTHDELAVPADQEEVTPELN